MLVIYRIPCYNAFCLQGRVEFPTGGDRYLPQVRKPYGMIRCESGTDSTVWMEEDGAIHHYSVKSLSCCDKPEDVFFRYFYFLEDEPMQKEKMSTRYMAAVAMFSAVSFVAVLVSKVIPNVAGFLSYEPKDAVIVIAGLLYGPLTSVLISVIVSFIEMISISSTGPYGMLMNIVSSCAFAVPAAWYYQRHRTQKDAVIGLAFGVLTMAVAMLLWNYIITPYYMGVPRETVAGMLMTVFLPFNLIKGGINAALTLLLYKPIVGALRHAGLAQPSSSGKGSFSAGFTLFALAVLITFVLLFLVMIGVL